MEPFSIIVPVYNEEDNVLYMYNEITKSIKSDIKYELIFVNDGSTDKTLDEIKKLTFDSRVKLYINKKNLGQSYSIQKGIKNSVNDIIVTIDGDGQNDPKDIIKLYDIYMAKENLKLVGGIRKKRKDKFIKKISSKIANYIRSRVLNDNCKDTGCSLKIFSKKIFIQFEYFDGIHRFLPALFNGYGYDNIYIDVNHRKRIKGYSKYGIWDRLFKGIKDLIKVREMIKLQKSKND